MPESRFSIQRTIEARGSTRGALSVDASAPDDPALLDTLLGGPLPAGDVELGRIQLRGEAGKSVVLGSGKARAEFAASAGGHGRFGVFASQTDVLAALELDTDPVGGVALPPTDGGRFGVIDWGYHAAVGGGIALQGKAAPRVEGNARRSARYVVLRRLPADLPGREAIRRTLNSLILPSQVTSATSLDPGTWVLAEVDGSIGVTVGAQYGYAVDWVREAALGGLTGDIGLRIKAGIDVALGYSAAGRYRVVVSRPTRAQVIRVQVFKLKRKGWDFALNAGATVEPVDRFLPEQFDAFLGGVFGIDGTQLLGDLARIRGLAEPGAALQALLGEGETVLGLLDRLVPGAATLTERYQALWARVDGLLTQWESLDHAVAAYLWSRLGHEEEVEAIRTAAAALSSLEGDDLREAILDRVEGSALGTDTVLQWLSSALEGDLLSGLSNLRTLRTLRAVASTTATVLDPNTLGVVLDALHGFIGDALHLDRVREAVDAGSVESLDPWLASRLESFLGAAVDAARLDDLARILTLLEGKAAEFFKTARAALARSYEVAFALAYSRSTERTALADVEIDGTHADSKRLLKQAISGELGRFLLTEHPAVTLRAGTLTHGVTRQKDVSVSLPLFKGDVREFTRSLATVDVTDEPGGRVALYAVDAENTVTRDNQRRSRLTLSGALEVDSNRVRQWSAPDWVSTYEYVEVFADARRAILEHRLEPLVETWFSDAFPIRADGSVGSLSTWLDDFDQTIARLAANGSDNFGNTLLRLSVALPAEAGAAWVAAPGAALAPEYRRMSLAMQTAMRRVMLRVSDSRPGFYKKRAESAALLTYAAIPPAHGASVRRDGSVNLRGARALHWNWQNRPLFEAMVTQPETLLAVATHMGSVHRRLIRSGEVSSNIVGRYEPRSENVKDVIKTALARRSTGLSDLERLLFVEKEAVESARDAGQAMARFRRSARTDAAEAVAALAEFGERVTKSFNAQLRRGFGERALPALSAELFGAAASGLDPTVEKAQRLAMLEVVTFQEDASFPPADLDGLGSRGDVLLTQRFVSR